MIINSINEKISDGKVLKLRRNIYLYIRKELGSLRKRLENLYLEILDITLNL